MDPQSKQDMPKKKSLAKEDSKKCLDLIKHLEKQNDAFLFLKPVDYKASGLDDYPLIIKRPMDLSTVKKKIKSEKYSSIKEVLADVNLIWENCKTYNQAGSPIYLQAEHMESKTKKYSEKHGLISNRPQKRPREETPAPQPEVSTSPEIISFEAKVDLAEKVRKSPNDILAEVVRIVENQCRKALEELDSERVQIKVDNLDKPTFERLWGLVNSQRDDDGKTVKKAKH
ncbi:unnamed protein product [Blepharisma stoltei]|uniref:Bromodomain testis-specific protein n=1 Tax=Blepharisma stoltei TaxID=1481888 RepID=A0AAU9ICM5_9CILI|nr:unnamed protein product [Blepharisma stoltei]